MEPFSTLKSSIKSLSSISVNDFLWRVTESFNLSAPGAASFENPKALSYKSEFVDDAIVFSSFNKKPTL